MQADPDDDDDDDDGDDDSGGVASIRTLAIRSVAEAWTEEERGSFWRGITRYGKSDSSSVSRLIRTRSPAEVAAYVQELDWMRENVDEEHLLDISQLPMSDDVPEEDVQREMAEAQQEATTPTPAPTPPPTPTPPPGFPTSRVASWKSKIINYKAFAEVVPTVEIQEDDMIPSLHNWGATKVSGMPKPVMIKLLEAWLRPIMQDCALLSDAGEITESDVIGVLRTRRYVEALQHVYTDDGEEGGETPHLDTPIHHQHQLHFLPSRPKPPRTLYSIFRSAKRQQSRGEGQPLASDGGLLSEWKALSAEEREVYRPAFLKDRERYNSEVSAYMAAGAKVYAAKASTRTLSEAEDDEKDDDDTDEGEEDEEEGQEQEELGQERQEQEQEQEEEQQYSVDGGEHGEDDELNARGWSPEEKRKLVKAVAKFGQHWQLIQRSLSWPRSAQQLYLKWSSMAKRRYSAEGPPPKKRMMRTGSWSKEEEEGLKRAVAEHGTQWVVIEKHSSSFEIAGRVADSMRDKWRTMVKRNPSLLEMVPKDKINERRKSR
eukprot:TRINITY_DN7389_c0_g1_i2.p1 TRINITY_DN7389_c0_g1~~TRINITY_DN7389_c0_g1_i2.p1  ORF type:complete len:634 (-),score=147.36 TRINITY_DN7389_c0_g1_i2:136-1767(-)